LQGGPWFYTHVEQNTLFRVVNHTRDLGHFLVLGATRSGKSTFGNVLRAMWLQYLHTQAKLFDLDGHGRLLTYLLGGSWYDLGSPDLRFQPLRYVDDPLRLGIAMQWLLDLMEEYGVKTTAPVQAYLGSNLAKLARLPLAQRTISRLITLMADGSRETELKANAGRIDAQGISHPDMDLRALVVLQTEIRTVLQRFTAKGEYGGLFDGTEDAFDANPIQTFELRTILQRPRLLGPVLRYVLTQVELQMTTDAPMLLLFVVAAIPWEVPRIREKSREWMMTTAKKAVSLGFMTHSLSQVFDSPLGPLLEESCPMRFFVPNKAAEEPNIAAIYQRMGLTPQAIRTIATARPQRDIYYYCKETGQQLFHLPLGPLTLACVARNRAEDHALIDTLLAREGREGFAAAWLREHHFAEEAAYVEAQTRQQQEPSAAAAD
jgi:type IV secretory pathway VirB4 component